MLNCSKFILPNKGMRRLIAIGIMAAASVAANAGTQAATDSIDTAVAVFVANNFKAALENALDNLESTGLKFNRAAVKELMFEELSKPYDASAATAASQTIERNIERLAAEASVKMLAEAAARPGAVTTESGLVFENIIEGTGASPKAESTVSIRYSGSLPDGHVFDSISPGEAPLEAVAQELAPGMTEALLLMKTGGKAVATVPAHLAYGKTGVPGVIPPDCTLRFEIELVDVKN